MLPRVEHNLAVLILVRHVEFVDLLDLEAVLEAAGTTKKGQRLARRRSGKYANRGRGSWSVVPHTQNQG